MLYVLILWICWRQNSNLTEIRNSWKPFSLRTEKNIYVTLLSTTLYSRNSTTTGSLNDSSNLLPIMAMFLTKRPSHSWQSVTEFAVISSPTFNPPRNEVWSLAMRHERLDSWQRMIWREVPVRLDASSCLLPKQLPVYTTHMPIAHACCTSLDSF